MSSAPSEVTRLLQRWTAGDVQARDQLIPLVYDTLPQLAHWRLRRAPGRKPATTSGSGPAARFPARGLTRCAAADGGPIPGPAARTESDLLRAPARAST